MENRTNEAANVTFQLVLLCALLAALGAMIYASLYVAIPEKNSAAFNILLGNVMGWIGALVAFGFPSSIGSAKKDDTIKRLADAASAPLTTTETRTTTQDTHE